MSKPCVKYFQSLWPPVVGRRAAIFICSPHPVLGELPYPKWVHTSEVLKINEKGDLETLNTEYIKVENPYETKIETQEAGSVKA